SRTRRSARTRAPGRRRSSRRSPRNTTIRSTRRSASRRPSSRRSEPDPGAQNPASQTPNRRGGRMSTDPAESDTTTASSTLEAVVAAPEPPEEHAKRRGAGRNLPAAIAVGAALLILLVGAVFVVPQAFPVVAAIAMSLAVLELTRALAHGGLQLPAVPLLVGVIGMVVSTVVFGAEGLLVATAAAVCVLILWRVSESMGLSALRDVAGGVFALAWVPFLGCFLMLLFAREDGAMLVLLAGLGPGGTDIGGYVAGVLFGTHPMAPRISPKKSWEGFAGSLLLGTAAVPAVGT